LKPVERVKLLKSRLSACQVRLESLELENPLPLDFYASIAWNRSLTVLRSEIEWLNEQLAQEQELHESDQLAENQAIFSQRQSS
jgi:hypothetical protein